MAIGHGVTAWAIAWIAAAFATGLVVAARVTPWACALARRLGVVAHANPDVPSHVTAIPLLGGVAFVAALAPWLGVAIARDGCWAGLAAGLVIVAALGAYKDRVEVPVSPLAQLAIQALAGAALWLGGLGLGGGVGGGFGGAALTVGLTVVVMNAWNFIDIMDGLAAGVAAASLPFFVGLGLMRGDLAMGGLAAGLAGGALGYLRFNWPPARVFMGDLGSFVLGLTFTALMLAAMRAPVTPAPLLALAVPLGDLAFTIASRLVAGRSPFRGGPEHAPLRLAARGWPVRRVLAAAYAAAIAGDLAAWLAMP